MVSISVPHKIEKLADVTKSAKKIVTILGHLAKLEPQKFYDLYGIMYDQSMIKLAGRTGKLLLINKNLSVSLQKGFAMGVVTVF